jgi:hypothetical protein
VGITPQRSGRVRRCAARKTFARPCCVQVDERHGSARCQIPCCTLLTPVTSWAKRPAAMLERSNRQSPVDRKLRIINPNGTSQNFLVGYGASYANPGE